MSRLGLAPCLFRRLLEYHKLLVSVLNSERSLIAFPNPLVTLRIPTRSRYAILFSARAVPRFLRRFVRFDGLRLVQQSSRPRSWHREERESAR